MERQGRRGRPRRGLIRVVARRGPRTPAARLCYPHRACLASLPASHARVCPPSHPPSPACSPARATADPMSLRTAHPRRPSTSAAISPSPASSPPKSTSAAAPWALAAPTWPSSTATTGATAGRGRSAMAATPERGLRAGRPRAPHTPRALIAAVPEAIGLVLNRLPDPRVGRPRRAGGPRVDPGDRRRWLSWTSPMLPEHLGGHRDRRRLAYLEAGRWASHLSTSANCRPAAGAAR